MAEAEDGQLVDADAAREDAASPTKKQRLAVAMIGLPAADAAGPSSRRAGRVSMGDEMTDAQKKIVSACLGDLLQEVAADVPISELRMACMDRGLEVDDSVLLAFLIQMQVDYTDGCGMPQIMVNDDDSTFFLVN